MSGLMQKEHTDSGGGEYASGAGKSYMTCLIIWLVNAFYHAIKISLSELDKSDAD